MGLVKCKDCEYFIKNKGCGLYYPIAKCSGELAIECQDFITKADWEKLYRKFKKRESLITGGVVDLSKICSRGDKP